MDAQQRYRDFIRAWFAAETILDVCVALKIDRRLASNIASTLRRRGIDLPRHRYVDANRPAVTGHVNWPALHEWAETCRSAAEMQRYRSA